MYMYLELRGILQSLPKLVFFRAGVTVICVSYGGPQGTRCKQKRNTANKKETLQIKKKRCKKKKKRCKQKRNAANKKGTLQTKKERCKQKRNAANKKEALQTKKGTAATIKKGTLQIKKRNAANKKDGSAANKKEHIMRAHTVPEGLGRVLPT